MKRTDVHINKVTDVYISAYSLIDNTPVVLSKYPMLQSLSIESSNFEDTLLYVIKLNNPMKEVNIVLEDNNIEMNIDYLGGCGRKNINWNSFYQIFTIWLAGIIF